MNSELYKPLTRAVVALFLIVLVKIVAAQILKDMHGFYSAVEIVLSMAVIIVLLRFTTEFNIWLDNSSPDPDNARSIVSNSMLLLVILTLYGTFSPYSDLLPSGLYHIIFFFLALIPVYYLGKILYGHSDRLSEIFVIPAQEKTICSCGFQNPVSDRFCGKCGLPLPERAEK